MYDACVFSQCSLSADFITSFHASKVDKVQTAGGLEEALFVTWAGENPLATENLREDADGLLHPLEGGGGGGGGGGKATQQWPLGAVACCRCSC